MLKTFTTMLSIIVLLLLCSCSEKTSKTEELNYSLTPKITINGNDSSRVKKGNFTFATYVDVDSKGNVFIVDKPSSSIKKFDKNGKFISTFGKKGSGPGEFENIGTFVISKDTIFVTEWSNRNLSKFTTDGQFINRVNISSGSPRQLSNFGDKLIGYNFSFTKEDNKSFMVNNISFFNRSFETIKVLKSTKIAQDPKNRPTVFDIYTSYCV